MPRQEDDHVDEDAKINATSVDSDKICDDYNGKLREQPQYCDGNTAWGFGNKGYADNDSNDKEPLEINNDKGHCKNIADNWHRPEPIEVKPSCTPSYKRHSSNHGTSILQESPNKMGLGRGIMQLGTERKELIGNDPRHTYSSSLIEKTSNKLQNDSIINESNIQHHFLSNPHEMTTPEFNPLQHVQGMGRGIFTNYMKHHKPPSRQESDSRYMRPWLSSPSTIHSQSTNNQVSTTSISLGTSALLFFKWNCFCVGSTYYIVGNCPE